VSNRDPIAKCLRRVDEVTDDVTWLLYDIIHVTSQSSKSSHSETRKRINYPCGPFKHILSLGGEACRSFMGTIICYLATIFNFISPTGSTSKESLISSVCCQTVWSAILAIARLLVTFSLALYRRLRLEGVPLPYARRHSVSGWAGLCGRKAVKDYGTPSRDAKFVWSLSYWRYGRSRGMRWCPTLVKIALSKLIGMRP